MAERLCGSRTSRKERFRCGLGPRSALDWRQPGPGRFCRACLLEPSRGFAVAQSAEFAYFAYQR